ncbi:Stk1 family PASTA domain-containing Ser/Thr kinase [Paenibacillus ginsengihumi]|uniref:Stk1 family PASTA domain-containing Ser/Thr kinase n=1 Tax=Paenibacillus ginsengihumi TaxID=431596 RepID=UPI000375C9AC|nr:Stk1 family PASTA domain-containing Ser/Thr kinase [Paenibacillus ginsengihumi]
MIGSRLGGRYEILEKVGGGGMAIVYKGLDILLHRHIAVKVLRQQYVHDEEFIHRFRREAQAAASLSHPNIVSIYDVGQQDDTHYIVMEYIEGTTLNELIKERAPLQVEEAVHIASQICDALDHAHHNQIIHRDIKPHNILIGRNGRVKVTDFGIARAVTSSTITQTGSVVGSVHYFSPEHAKGISTGEQSDLYSLGIVMYQMLTGRLPFLGESPISVALKHLQEEVEEPRKVNPLIPQSVENIILKAMRKNASERYRSAKDMMNDLETSLLPHRRNEPKLDFADEDELDEERTLVMPAIRPGQYDIRAAADEEEAELDGEDAAAAPPRRQKRWVKPTVWFAVLMSLLAGMWYLVGYVKEAWVVQDVLVPTVVNKPLEEALQLLTNAQLKPAVQREHSDTVAQDVVIRQSPADIRVKPQSTVTLIVSDGRKKEKIPNVIGGKLADAKLALTALGIPEGNIQVKEEPMPEEEGTVAAQQPDPNTEVDPAEAKVVLTVSKGPEKVAMPNLIGATEEEAKNMIAAKKLKLAKDAIQYEESYKHPKDRVIMQFPFQPDEQVPVGSEITKLVVSSGFPEEAGQMTVMVPIGPAQQGRPSTVEIILSDAQFDNHKYTTLSNITASENVEVRLVVSPDKNATIQIRTDGKQTDVRTITYKDYEAWKNGETNPPEAGESGSEETQPVHAPAQGGAQDGQSNQANQAPAAGEQKQEGDEAREGSQNQ